MKVHQRAWTSWCMPWLALPSWAFDQHLHVGQFVFSFFLNAKQSQWWTFRIIIISRDNMARKSSKACRKEKRRWRKVKDLFFCSWKTHTPSTDSVGIIMSSVHTPQPPMAGAFFKAELAEILKTFPEFFWFGSWHTQIGYSFETWPLGQFLSNQLYE